MAFEMKILFLAAGMFFLMSGLAIAITENPTYSQIITPLYIYVVYFFYFVMVIAFIQLLLSAFDFMKKNLKGSGPKIA